MAQLAGSTQQHEERTIRVCCGTSSPGGFALAARVFGGEGIQQRVVMYPGSPDNAAVFDALAAQLAAAGFLVVAVDPPGCGLSQHRQACDYYNGARQRSRMWSFSLLHLAPST